MHENIILRSCKHVAFYNLNNRHNDSDNLGVHQAKNSYKPFASLYAFTVKTCVCLVGADTVSSLDAKQRIHKYMTRSPRENPPVMTSRNNG